MCDPSRPPGPALRRPRWGLLYVAAFSPLAALAVVEVAAPPSWIRTLLRGVFALTAFVGMAVWVRASRAALDMLNWCACAGETVTVRLIESPRPHQLVEQPPPTPVAEPAEEERELVLR